MSRKLSLLTCMLLVLLVAVTSQAQVTSRVTGVVQDKTGAMISGATVTLTNQETNVSFTATTTTAGTYVFDAVKPGTYKVSITASGFKTFSTTGNMVTIGQPTTVNATLQVGSTGENIEVSAAAELVQTSTSGNIGTTIDLSALNTLPIVGTRGRNPLQLVELTPGVTDSGGFNQGGPNVAGGGVHVNGSRDRAWNYTLDGIDINETSAGGSNFSPLRTNPDMLSEFRVMTSNFTSEFGRNSGAQVEMVSKSGTNGLHGTGFFFYQTPSLMANDPANKEAGLPRPQWVQKIPGFSIGGPIIKNKTFFFANFQWLRTLKTIQNSQLVYTESARKGLLRYVTGGGQNTPAGSPGASIDASGNVLASVPITTYDVVANDPQHVGLDAQVQKILNMQPAPNDFSKGDGLNMAGFNWLAAEHERQLDYSIRVDHTFNDRHSIFTRYSGGHQNTIADTANAGLPIFPGTPNVVDTYRTPRNLAASWRWAINPRMLNEFTVGMNRFIFDFANPDPNYQSNPAFNFWAHPFCGDNSICMNNPLQNYVGNKRALTTYQLVDNFSFTQGAHAFKFGINFRYGRHIDDRGSIGDLDAAPAINFDPGINAVDPTVFNLPANINSEFDLRYLQGTINELLGRVGEINQGIVAANGTTWAAPWTHLRADFRMPEYDFYVQDSWKMRRNLTVDLGLRWELRPSARVTDSSRMLRPDPPLGWGNQSDTLKWVPGNLYRDYYKNLGPSIGFAWDPKGDGKMSIRSNYRLAYDRINTFSLSSAVFQGFPGLTQQVFDDSFGEGGGRLQQLTPAVFNSLISAGLTSTPTQLRQPDPYGRFSSITVVDPNWRPPQTHMWSFGIQRELPLKMVLEVDYIGRRGQNLYGAYNANQVDIVHNGFLDAFKVVQGGGDSPLINQLLAQDGRIPSGVTGSQWLRDPTSPYYSDFSNNGAAAVAYSMATRSTPLNVAAGLGQFFFLPYPQFAGGFRVLDSHDRSMYHGLQTVLRRAYANGLTFQASWVWSKSLDTRSFDPTFSTVVGNSSPWGASSTPFNLDNRKLNYAPSDFDRTHMFQSIWVYELPFGHNKRWGHSWNGFVDRVLGGWEIGGFGILETGRPTTIYSLSKTLSNVVRTPASCNGCSPHMFSIHTDPSTGLLTYVTPEQIAKFYNPAPGQFSNVGRNYFRLAGYKNLSLSIGKKTKVTERQQIETRLEIQNLTNSVQYDEPATNYYGSSAFGVLDPQMLVLDWGRGLSSDPRKMQVSVKYTF